MGLGNFLRRTFRIPPSKKYLENNIPQEVLQDFENAERRKELYNEDPYKILNDIANARGIDTRAEAHKRFGTSNQGKGLSGQPEGRQNIQGFNPSALRVPVPSDAPVSRVNRRGAFFSKFRRARQ